MANDELDPAFLDLDLPRLGSSSLQSLGAGFGGFSLDSNDDDDDDALDDALDDEEDSFAAQLGAGFGSTLSSELADLSGFGSSREGDDNSSDSDSPRRVHDSLSDGRAKSTNGDDSDDDLSRCVPRRRRRVPTRQQVGSTATLAAELAANDADRRPQRERALLHELGLGDDDDNDESARAATSDAHGASSEEEADDNLSKSRADGRQIGRGHRQTRTSARRNGGATPLSSLESETTPDAEDERRERELEDAVQEIAHATEGTTADIDAFLQRLRASTTAFEAAHSHSGKGPVPEPALAGSSQTLSAREPYAAPTPFYDRQSIVEDLSAKLLRNLQLSSAKRNDDLRDLTLLERELGRTDPGWRNAISLLEPLVRDDHGDSCDRSTSEAPELPSDGAIPERAGTLEPSSTDVTAAIASELASLRLTTQSLLAIFASLTEQTQVQSALASEAGRKLRAFRTQLSSLRDDFDGVQRSEEFVRTYEGRRTDQAEHGQTSIRVRQDVDDIRTRLDRGWRQAQELLLAQA